MAKKTIIDRETAQRIIDTANILEVVQDFVSLKRRGASYVGLCPFHNDRSPSFYVTPSKGICKCFSCGKGGSAVNFIMEHEQLTYWEALRYLARKYNIQIQEHEMTDEERRANSERQTLMSLNEFAMKHFQERMAQTDEGRDIGLSYFRHRGISDAAIEKFKLGYAPEAPDDLSKAAMQAGYSRDALIKTGLCYEKDHGGLSDRFRGRVIYPVFTIAGKVVAFGGRILSSEKKIAKYVNSPESQIYSKSRELYGLYQAKNSIVRNNKCILVEGYMDVISMSQSGVENVVASSGTALTRGQVRLIHRFAENVTVIYDSDAAGIKASLRGIDILLAEGLNIKVLSLPDGEDPDSFAQSHTSEELVRYIAENEVDFMQFKTEILLKDASGDPIARAKAVGDIVRSIAVIPDEITRTVYIRECSMRFEMAEGMLTRQVSAARAKYLEQLAIERKREEARQSVDNPPGGVPANNSGAGQTPGETSAGGVAPGSVTLGNEAPGSVTPGSEVPAGEMPSGDMPGDDFPGEAIPEQYLNRTGPDHKAAILAPQERLLLRLAIRYGMLDLGEDYGQEADGTPIKVIDYINEDLEQDGLEFCNPELSLVYNELLEIRANEWESEYQTMLSRAAAAREEQFRAGVEEIAREATNMDEISRRETRLREVVDENYATELRDFARNFFERRLLSHPDDTIRKVSTELVVERHQLSKIYFRNHTKIETEEDRLSELVPRALLGLKYDLARWLFTDLSRRIKELTSDPDYDLDRVLPLMQEQQRWSQFCAQVAIQIGERVYEPLR